MVPRYQGPPRCLLRRRQGGPWAPPPCSVQIPGDVEGSSILFFCCGLGFIIWFFVSRFCLWVWYLVWSLSPSSPDPCLVFVGVPLLFFCLVGFVGAVFSLLFSFSQVLGKPKPPSGGFGVPLVFLLRGRALRPRSVHLHFLLHQGSRPALFFFLSRRRSRGCFSGVFLVALSVCLVVCVGFFGGSSALHARCIMHSLFGGRETIISPLPFIIMVTVSGAWASHGGPIGTAYQIRGRSPHPLPAECCKGQPRKGVGDRIGQQPYCHTHC